MRTEEDFLGKHEIDENAFFGIHSMRAKENFPDTTQFHIEWYKAVGLTKQACYITYRNFKKAVKNIYGNKEFAFPLFEDEIINALEKSSIEVAEGKYFNQFIVPAIQGGAGTSINMNINEIIANVSLNSLGKKAGNYAYIDPIEHANIFQSTNDVIPTSLKIAVMKLLIELEDAINNLRATIEEKEKKFRNYFRVAYTQMQEAVPSSYGILFSTYNEALSRDWWRVSKCLERIKTVNIGGSAAGTGITVPRYFIMEVVRNLQILTNLPLSRSENMPDATCNLDSFAEVHAILKAHAVNLEKISNDIRFLSSDFNRNHEVEIPKRQLGSSIMPGKVNPVIVEYVISAAHKVYSNDSLISSLCGLGCLDLNAYIPLIGHAMIESIKLLISSCNTFNKNLLENIKINNSLSETQLLSSQSIATALVPFIGYNKAAIVANEMKNSKCSIFEANHKLKLIDEEKLQNILKPSNLLKMGFSIEEIK